MSNSNWKLAVLAGFFGALSSAIIITSIFVLAEEPNDSQVPKLIPYEGTLQLDNTPFNGPIDMRVEIYDSAQDGNKLWEESQSVSVYNGSFRVILGSTSESSANSLADVIRNSNELYLQIVLSRNGTEIPLNNRQLLLALPYSASAGTLQGHPASDFVKPENMLAHLKMLLNLDSVPDDEFTADLHNLITKECPVGYLRSTSAEDQTFIVCKRGSDEMVKVGDFWIDRYEIALANEGKYNNGSCNGSGSFFGQYGGSQDWGEESGFARNGSDIQTNLYACSVKNVMPTRWMTYFQAQQACALAGKHLCTNAEWQTAARGTPDGLDKCNLTTHVPVNTASHAQCVSYYGAYDMVGNLTEWVSDWFGAGNSTGAQSNDGDYHSDYYENIYAAQHGEATLPPAMKRGGHWSANEGGGVFWMQLSNNPSEWDVATGARCCKY